MNFIHIVLAFLFVSTSIVLAASTSANVPSADPPKLSSSNPHIDAMDKKETRHAIFRKQDKEGIRRILEAERKVIKPYKEKEREGLSVHGLNTLALSAARGEKDAHKRMTQSYESNLETWNALHE